MASEVKFSSERSENCLSKQCKCSLQVLALKRCPTKSLSQAHNYIEWNEVGFGAAYTHILQVQKAHWTQCLNIRL